MEFLKKIFNFIKKKEEAPSVQIDETEPKIRDDYIPNTINLGWYYSENKNEFQMAKIPERDALNHFYILGFTGSGKTKFMEFLIEQDIGKRRGFGVIDPNGDLIRDVKGTLACYMYGNEKDLEDKVVIIDPTDPKFTVTFNPLEKIPDIPLSEQVSELVSAFKKTWKDSWGVRMEELLRNSLISLAEAGLTLADLPYFLTSQPFRRSVLEKVSSVISKEYFHRFDTLTDRARVSWIEPVMNKINAFLFNDRIRQMFSFKKSSFNLRDIMDNKKILLINLDKGKLKDSADLLGSLFMAKIQMAAFSRSDIPEQKRVPFFLYIDEFQDFATESFSIILSQARKYGLFLRIAHQNLSQIPSSLKDLILGNCGLQVYFRLSRHDAQILAKEAFEYSGTEIKSYSFHHGYNFWSYAEEWEHYISELQNLPNRFCYIKHKIEGGIIPIQTAEIEPPWKILNMEEDEYLNYFCSLQFGKKYLFEREALEKEAKKKEVKVRETIKERIVEPKRAEVIATAEKELLEGVPQPSYEKIKEISAQIKEKRLEGRGGPKHKYLQQIIKRFSEEKGFRAIVEKPIDGKWVDVSLEKKDEMIACQVSLTTNEKDEIENAKSCLEAGYKKVIFISPEKRVLERLKRASLNDEMLKDRVSFLSVRDFFDFLEKEAKAEEKVVAGYKIKVRYQPVSKEEEKIRKKEISKVILKSLKKMK